MYQEDLRGSRLLQVTELNYRQNGLQFTLGNARFPFKAINNTVQSNVNGSKISSECSW